MSPPEDYISGHEASLLRNILANADVGIVETDLKLCVRLNNRMARQLINDGKDIMGESLSELIREGDLLEAITQRLLDEEIHRHEGKWTPAQTEHHTEFRGIMTLSREEDYAVSGFLLMCDDVVFHRVCCDCGKVQLDGEWTSLEEVMNRTASLSHTYCPACLDKAIKKVKGTKKKKK